MTSGRGGIARRSISGADDARLNASGERSPDRSRHESWRRREERLPARSRDSWRAGTTRRTAGPTRRRTEFWAAPAGRAEERLRRHGPSASKALPTVQDHVSASVSPGEPRAATDVEGGNRGKPLLERAENGGVGHGAQTDDRDQSDQEGKSFLHGRNTSRG